MGTKNSRRDDQATQDLLDLGSDKLAMLSVIATSTDEHCQQAEAWATARHFRASDDAVHAPTIPLHVAALAEQRDIPQPAPPEASKVVARVEPAWRCRGWHLSGEPRCEWCSWGY
jgi:hypothetical protein